MSYAAADYTHIFSPEAMVSLEMPAGWELEEEADRAAVIGYPPADEQLDYPPTLVIKAIALPGAGPHAHRELALHTLEIPRTDMRAISHRLLEVDGFPASEDVFSFYEIEMAEHVVQYQVFAQADQAMFSITGMVEQGHEDEYLPVFSAAVDSIRFIPMAKEG